MFTKDEVAKRSYEKAEKFRRDQAAQLEYAEKKGEEKGIRAMIVTLKELDIDKATTIDKVMARFNLKPDLARGYVEANW